MEFKKGLGLILIIAGIIIIIAQPFSPTGAVIDISTTGSKASFAIGLGLIIGGIVLFITKASDLEKSTAQRLWEETTHFLGGHGLDYFGREKAKIGPEEYKQQKFEERMKTGAFSSQREKHH